MEKVITVALVGMGGYGSYYVEEILNNSETYGMDCVAMVDIYPEKSKYVHEVKARGIPIYSNMEELYEKHRPQLVFISTPIQFHCRQSCFALQHGSHVLCEKPTAATLEDAKTMLKEAESAGKFVIVGFQKCFNRAVLRAKEDILSGKYGKLIKMKAVIGQQRTLAYYQRGWAGRIKVGEDYIYDSVANNSAAHYLHNLFFLAGEKLNVSAFPDQIEAECYRGNDIENYDTITTKIRTVSGVEVYFAAFQCGKRNYPHCAHLQFEGGMMEIAQDGSVVGQLSTGERLEYGNFNRDDVSKVKCAVEAVRGKDTIYCDINTAMAHTYTIQFIQNHMKVIDLINRAEVINVGKVGEEPNLARCVKGLDEAILHCYDQETMLSSWLLQGTLQ